jgi:excisionase family DNA binding protein
MKTYSVKDIADMLNTNPETVRRWIRAGKLKADQTSRKDGNMVREDDLYKYLRSTTKYAAIATGLAATNPFLALTTAVGAGVLGAIVTSLAAKPPKNGREVRILSDDVKRTLKKNITESEETIERKKAAIAELQAEINKEQQQIRDYETALEHLSDAMSAVKGNDPGEVIG